MRQAAASVITLLFLLPLASAASFPSPTGHVNDFAGILTDAAGMEAVLADYQLQTGVEIAVVTIDGLPQDQTLFTYGVELFEEWGIGKEGEDNGLLVLMNKAGEPGNRMRMEVGYGLQGYITGAEAGRMLDAALPLYEQGDYQAAAETILNMVSEELQGYSPSNPIAGDKGVDTELLFFMAAAVFFVLIMMAAMFLSKERCPICGSEDIQVAGDYVICRKCKHRTKRRHRYAPLVVAGGFGGGYGRGGGGFGGFGGGGSGGGGAGR